MKYGDEVVFLELRKCVFEGIMKSTEQKCNVHEAKLYDEAKQRLLEVQEALDLIDSKQHARFQLPSDKTLIDIAILFNGGKLQRRKLADMVAMCQFVIDRLYENGDVTKPSSKEKN